MDEKTDAIGTSLGAFELYFPMPYRALFLLNLGGWLWLINLSVFAANRVDVTQVLHFTHADVTLPGMQTRLLKVLRWLFVAYVANHFIYLLALATGSDFSFLEYLPLIGIATTLTGFFYPSIITGDPDYPEADRFRSTFKRVLPGQIDVSLRTNDILMADTITSYNRMIVDLLAYVSAMVLGYRSLPLEGSSVLRDHIELYDLDLICSYYPSLMRLVQCLHEYNFSHKKNKQPFFNAIKYSTALLPVLAEIMIRGGYFTTLRAWYFGALVNSTYSFIWDISLDWELGLLKGEGLSRPVSYPENRYRFALVADCLLRYIWIWRLIFPVQQADSNIIAYYLSSLYTTEAGSFALQLFELLRRAQWISYKVETRFSMDSQLDVQLSRVAL